MPSKAFCSGKRPCEGHRMLDVLSEIKQRRNEMKEFFEGLDNQHILFKDYVLAVMKKYNCDGVEAGRLICRHLKGEY